MTLTDIQANDLRRLLPLPLNGPAIRTITTCADFDQFAICDDRSVSFLPAEVRSSIEGKRIIGLIGSLNASYRSEETARLCRMILEEAADAHILVLSPQRKEYEALLGRNGIPRESCTLCSAPHEQMSTWLSYIDWGPLLLDESFAKRASMPTKLAEFFASGVRPVQFGCNAEVSDWVRRVGTGIVLPSLDEQALRAAARTIATSPRDLALLRKGRRIAAPHFRLSDAIQKYDRLLHEIVRLPAENGSQGRTHFPERPDKPSTNP